MKKDVIYLLAIVILGFVVMRQCTTAKPGGEGSAKKQDTLYLPGKTDSIPFEVEVIKYKWLKPDATEEIVDSVTGDTTMAYETIIDDSLITATIKSRVKGTLLGTDFEYKPKFPKFIHRVDTMKITIPYEVPKNKWEFYVGAELGGNATMFRLQPTLLVRTPKKLQVSLGYGLIHKTYNVGVYTQLVWPK